MRGVDLSVEVGGLRLANPVMTASGTFGYGLEFLPYLDLRTLGAIVVKGVTLAPRKGNPPPRIMETPSGLLNTIGLENVGVDALVREKLPRLAEVAPGVPVIANASGETLEEYVELAGRLDACDLVAAIELNISCPNVARGGMHFGTRPETAAALTAAVRKVTRKPLIVKLSPNVTDIVSIARACQDAGADALSAINTLLGMSIDVEARRPHLSRVVGGLSGPAIRPVAVRAVWEIARAVSVPVVGMGGIFDARDAVEFLLAGARAVAVGTVCFVDPGRPGSIIEGIREYMERHGFSRVEELNEVGKGFEPAV